MRPRRIARPRLEAMEPRALLATFVVTSVADAGPGTLRQAILDANAANGASTINFAIAGTGLHTIRPLTGLPQILSPTTIDGYSEPGARPGTNPYADDAAPSIELDGGGLLGVEALLNLGSGPSVVRGLVLDSSTSGPGVGIAVHASGCRISGNVIGTDLAGLRARGFYYGIAVVDAADTEIGGSTPSDRNTITGNGRAGVFVQSTIAGRGAGNRIQGNFIGLTRDGRAKPLAPPGSIFYFGVQIQGSSGNLVGGASPGQGNVISGVIAGLTIGDDGTNTATGNLVQGNRFGSDSRLTVAIPQERGIEIIASGNTVGGIEAGASNTFVGSTFEAIHVVAYPDYSKATGNVIQGNRIGVDLPGGGHLGNNGGINVQGNSNLVGGLDPAAGNRIIHTTQEAILVSASPGGNTVLSNTFLDNDSGLVVYSPFPALDVYPDPGAPTLSAARDRSGAGLITGSLGGAPGRTYYVQFFETPAGPSKVIEADTLLGTLTVVPDATGKANLRFNATLTLGSAITATATAADPSPAGISSGVSAPIIVVARAGGADGDFDGDGRTDLAVFRPASSNWLGQLTGGGVLSTAFGAPSLLDLPVPGDYDGIGKAELAVFRPSTGQWLIRNPSGSGRVVSFGAPNLADIPAPADFDGDGRTDLAVFRPSTGQWLIQLSGGGSRVVSFGAPNLLDIPVPADYDGDGKADLAVFRPSEARFLSVESGGGVLNRVFGATNLFDIPTQAPIAALAKLGRVGGVRASGFRVPSTPSTSLDIAIPPDGVEVVGPRARNRRASAGLGSS